MTNRELVVVFKLPGDGSDTSWIFEMHRLRKKQIQIKKRLCFPHAKFFIYDIYSVDKIIIFCFISNARLVVRFIFQLF